MEIRCTKKSAYIGCDSQERHEIYQIKHHEYPSINKSCYYHAPTPNSHVQAKQSLSINLHSLLPCNVPRITPALPIFKSQCHRYDLIAM